MKAIWLITVLGLVFAGCGEKRSAIGAAYDGALPDGPSGDAGTLTAADGPAAADVPAGPEASSDLADERGPALDGPALDGPALEAPPAALCGGQGDPQDCAAANALKLEAPTLPFAPDGSVERGKNIVFQVTLANRGTKDFSTYPCVSFVSDHPLVKFLNGPPGCNCLFAIFAGMTATIQDSAPVNPAIPVGTVVHVTATVAPLHGRCAGLSQVTVPVTVR